MQRDFFVVSRRIRCRTPRSSDTAFAEPTWSSALQDMPRTAGRANHQTGGGVSVIGVGIWASLAFGRLMRVLRRRLVPPTWFQAMVASSQKSRTFAGRETGGSAEFFGSTECMQARLPELHTMSKSLRRTMFDAIRRMLHSSVNPCSDVWLDAFLKLGLPKLDEPGHTRDFYAFVAEASAYLLPLLALRDGFADRLGH